MKQQRTPSTVAESILVPRAMVISGASPADLIEAFDAQTQDLYTDALSSNVSYMRKKLRLLSQLELRDTHDCTPVIKVRHKEDGGFEIDPAFMGPSRRPASTP